MQGTLTDLSFSEEFWYETLPALYAKNSGIPLSQAKKEIEEHSDELGKYNPEFYSLDYWIDRLRLKFTPDELLKFVTRRPQLNEGWLPILKGLSGKAMLIVVSSAVRQFVDAELGEHRALFAHTFSSIDDFGIAGKIPELYKKVSEKIGISADRILHIGDDLEMDVKNSEAAGWTARYFDKSKPLSIVENIWKI